MCSWGSEGRHLQTPSKLQNLIQNSRAALFPTQEAAAEAPSQFPVNLTAKPYRALQGQTRVRVPNINTAQNVLAGLQTLPHPTAAKLYTILFDVALGVSQGQGHPVLPSQVVIHQPVEIIAAALGLSRMTVYRHLKTLTQLGLVHARGHVGNWFGLSRKTGTLFAVALRPGLAPVRLRFDDLHHCHRDLQSDTQADAKECRTAWKFLQGLKLVQSRPESQKAAQSALFIWSKNPGQTTPVKNLIVTPGNSDVREVIYSLSELSSTHKTKQAALVDSFARCLARGFLDSVTNLNFWRKLLWDALKRDWEGLNTLSRLSNALIRLMADVQEWEGLKRPGALLVSRLKASGVWEDLKYT